MARAVVIVFDRRPMHHLQLVSLLGLLAMLGLCFLVSHDRKAISWRLVGVGVVVQAVLGFLFLYWSTGNAWLRAFGDGVKAFLDLAQAGTSFVFGALASYPAVDAAFGTGLGFIFATQVLPTLIFFSAFMAVLYHVGIMQLVVRAMAVVTARLLGTSGAESLSACGNVFVGQTEAPLLVRPFLSKMTTSELHTVMVGGFATIAGGVFALYVGFGIEPGHLMVASVMAVPAGLICSKMMWPETGEPETRGRTDIDAPKTASNVVEAAANGATDGLRLALNVGAMLIAFLGLMAVVNWLLGWVGDGVDEVALRVTGSAVFGGERLSLDAVLGWLFSPIAALMGVPSGEILVLAELLGKKLVLTELIAYQELGELERAGAVSERTMMIASFALCGFANIGSVAIQIGGLGAIAPERRSEIAKLAFRAMFGGALATCMTACLAGVMSVV